MFSGRGSVIENYRNFELEGAISLVILHRDDPHREQLAKSGDILESQFVVSIEWDWP